MVTPKQVLTAWVLVNNPGMANIKKDKVWG